MARALYPAIRCGGSPIACVSLLQTCSLPAYACSLSTTHSPQFHRLERRSLSLPRRPQLPAAGRHLPPASRPASRRPLPAAARSCPPAPPPASRRPLPAAARSHLPPASRPASRRSLPAAARSCPPAPPPAAPLPAATRRPPQPRRMRVTDNVINGTPTGMLSVYMKRCRIIGSMGALAFG